MLGMRGKGNGAEERWRRREERKGKTRKTERPRVATLCSDRNANGAEIEISSRFGRKRRFYDIKQRFCECC